MENAFLCGAVDYAASFIECFFNSFSVTSGDSFGRTADSGMNRRFNLRVSCVASCVFFHRFDIGFNLRQWIHLPNYKNTRRNFTIWRRKKQYLFYKTCD